MTLTVYDNPQEWREEPLDCPLAAVDAPIFVGRYAGISEGTEDVGGQRGCRDH